MTRPTLLKHVEPAAWVVMLDHYREATGLEPARSLAGVPVAYLKGLPRDQEAVLTRILPWEWLLIPSGLAQWQLVAALRQRKVVAYPVTAEDWGQLRARLNAGRERTLLYGSEGGGAGRAWWPVRAFEAAVVRHALDQLVSVPDKYLVDLKAPPEAFRQFPEGLHTLTEGAS
jgi:hypothetical protein